MSANGRHLFTSESVTEGHPDKIADQISDSILDAIIAQDPVSRVACETLVTTGLAIVAGEITTSAYVDFQDVVRSTIREVGYTRGKFGFDAETCAVLSSIHSQSPDIAMGVDTGGAGDQGLMFGYACRETEELMPLPIMLAHKLVRGLSCMRRDGVLDYLRPDGKSQVTVEYEGSRPIRVDTVVVSSQHSPLVSQDTMREDIIEKIILKVVPAELLDKNTKFYVNPTGRFVVGGPHGDAGVTGRKIIVDTVRRRRAARWWRLLGQRSDQGGPFGLLHGPVHRQERGGVGHRRAGAGPAGLRHRRGRPGVGHGAHRRHQPSTGRDHHGARSGTLQADATRHHGRAGSAPPDLQEDSRLRAFRPHRAGVHLGANRQSRGPSREREALAPRRRRTFSFA